MTPEELDLRGLKCPMPVLRTAKALKAMAPGARLRVVCTDPMSAIDIPNMLRETGNELADTSRERDCLVFEIVRRVQARQDQPEAERQPETERKAT